MPTLEKLLVDILRDVDFFYLQGNESHRIIENAFTSYTVNQSRLFRYAGRRKVKEELSSILVNWNVQSVKLNDVSTIDGFKIDVNNQRRPARMHGQEQHQECRTDYRRGSLGGIHVDRNRSEM